jgi:hypothetical protein
MLRNDCAKENELCNHIWSNCKLSCYSKLKIHFHVEESTLLSTYSVMLLSVLLHYSELSTSEAFAQKNRCISGFHCTQADTQNTHTRFRRRVCLEFESAKDI